VSTCQSLTIPSSPPLANSRPSSDRAIDQTTQNTQRKDQQLAMPVLAIGGEKSSGEAIGTIIKLAADDVQSVGIPGSGHWVAEEGPDDILTALC